ncbi:MAG TPA: hypothetical protein VNK67_02910 [Burkholderiales bacterium]|nr:hypothetical protein [Burkholderiales bacterium]
MDKIPKQLRLAINSQAAHVAALELVVIALCRQVPRKAKLVRDFEAMAEDHEIRTLYSRRPESFYEAFASARDFWRKQLLPPELPPRPSS